jgi:hypothetical protein
MERVVVTSSNILSVGYADDTQTLEVQFKFDRHGVSAVWQYSPIERETFEDIIDPANSAGTIIRPITQDRSLKSVRMADVVRADDATTEVA